MEWIAIEKKGKVTLGLFDLLGPTLYLVTLQYACIAVD